MGRSFGSGKTCVSSSSVFFFLACKATRARASSTARRTVARRARFISWLDCIRFSFKNWLACYPANMVWSGLMIGDLHNQLDSESDIPLYRQLHEKISASIKLGSIRNGERLPPTRELAGELGLNPTTVFAAYALLEEDRLIRGQGERGGCGRH